MQSITQLPAQFLPPSEIQKLSAGIGDFFRSINIDSYQDVMNPTVWSSQSIEGIIVLLLLLVLVYKLFNKAYRFAWWCVGLIVFIQCMYLLGGTAINNYIPLRTICPYDVLQSIAQLFVGTGFADALLWVDELLTRTVGIAGEAFLKFVQALWRIFSSANPLTM